MNTFYQDPYVQVIQGDCREVLAKLPAESVQCVITSPPYWGLRKYSGEQELDWRGWKGAYGLEPTPEMYIEHTIEILREIRRVLRKDGVVFWNIGDSYFSSTSTGSNWDSANYIGGKGKYAKLKSKAEPKHSDILKPKDLCLIPLRVAIAAQEDGWWVRSVIIWSKPNPMPESVTDRPAENHDYILMLTKSARYYWDADAVREITGKEASWDNYPEGDWADREQDNIEGRGHSIGGHRPAKRSKEGLTHPLGRNLRSVWEFPTEASGLEMCLKCKTVYESAAYRRLLDKVRGKTTSEIAIEHGYDPDDICPVCGRTWKRHAAPNASDRRAGLRREFTPCTIEARGRPLESPIHPYRGDGWGEQAIEGRDVERKVKVCRCGASDWLSHFAVFPEKLPEICIKAATPEVGCCSMCGAPYERVISKSEGRARQDTKWSPGTEYGPSPKSTLDLVPERRTIKWQPTCNCVAEVVPSVVLDPLAGSGRTGKVAKDLGRKAILIDTSEDYCRLAKRRIEVVPLPMIFPVEETYPKAPDWF